MHMVTMTLEYVHVHLGLISYYSNLHNLQLYKCQPYCWEKQDNCLDKFESHGGTGLGRRTSWLGDLGLSNQIAENQVTLPIFGTLGARTCLFM